MKRNLFWQIFLGSQRVPKIFMILNSSSTLCPSALQRSDLLQHDGKDKGVLGTGAGGGGPYGGAPAPWPPSGSSCRTSGLVLIRAVLALAGHQLAGAATAERRVRAVRVERTLHRHAAPLRLPPYSVWGQLSGVDTCWVCLQHLFLLIAPLREG